MKNQESLTEVARRQVHAVLRQWDLTTTPADASIRADALVDAVMAALAYEPSVTEFAADLQEITRSRFGAGPSWVDCLTAARDLLDGYRLLTITVIDAA